jgi:hypothetical protein
MGSKLSFWVQFAIMEAITVVDMFIARSNLTDTQKQDGLALVSAAQKFLNDF